MPPSNRPEADRAAEGLLVDRCRRGDPAAFEEIYRRHAPRVYSLACRLTGSLADAEDLLQELFCWSTGNSTASRATRRWGPGSTGWRRTAAWTSCAAASTGRSRRPTNSTRRCRRRAGGGGAARRAPGPRARDRATAARDIGRRSCCTTWKASSTRSGGDAGHRRGHVEVAGAQGADEAARPAGRRAGDGPDVTGIMNCDTYRDRINELVDGDAGWRRPPRAGRAPGDLRRVPRAGRGSARDPPRRAPACRRSTPPDRVWQQMAPRVAAPIAAAPRPTPNWRERLAVTLAIAAVLLAAVAITMRRCDRAQSVRASHRAPPAAHDSGPAGLAEATPPS